MSNPPKITRVVLYKHGIASFERQALVEDNQTIDLNFKQSEMNDVLKSLTVLDVNGGNISSISYNNNKPIDQRVAESNFNVTNCTSILSLISQLTGVEVSLDYEGQNLCGVIASTAEFTTKDGKAGYISLWHENCLKLLELAKTSNIQVRDATIQKQLSEALDIQRESKIKGQKTMTIFATGKGKRQVNISYFIEAPVWKVSYRVVIPETSKDNEKSDEMVLQAWAIVDNITEEPWEDVQLTLISGEPHSCTVDLFNPIFKKSEGAAALPSARAARAPKMQQMQQMLPQQMMMNCIPQSMDLEVEPTATKELGDMFQYDIVHPVTVQKNESALVPIAEKNVKGTRVALFNPERHTTHPNSAILLVNTTGLTLEGGPCAVIDSGTFVGEFMLDTVQRGENKFIEYATEVSSDIWKTETSSQVLHSSSIQNSQLCLVKKIRYITTYHLRNKSPKDLEVYIEHRFRKDCKVVDTPEPTNPNPINFCIYKAHSPAKETEKFVVTEERLQSTSMDMSSINRSRYNDLIQDGGLTKDASERVNSYLSLKEQATRFEEQITSAKADITKIFENHNRIRSNLSSLYNQGSGAHSLRDKYLAEMEADETKIAVLEDKIKALESERSALLSEASSILQNITMASQ